MGRKSLKKPRQERSDVADLLAAARQLCAQRSQQAPVVEASLWCRNRSSSLLQLPNVSLDIALSSVDVEHGVRQRPSFRAGLELHDFQLPSLGWMIAREGGAPIRLNIGNEFQTTCVQGGILADSVGFGKTVITLALLDQQRAPLVPRSAPIALTHYFIPSRATVIITPPNLWEQWNREIQKFLETEHLQVITAADIKVFKKCTVDDFAKADIIIISYKMFDSPQYKDRLTQLGSGGKGTRLFVRALFEASQGEAWASDGFEVQERQCSTIPLALARLKFPVMEMFYFHRIVADEFHELVCAVGQASHPFYRAMVSLCELHARCRWGLTSTPPVKSVFEVATTAAFFHVDLPSCIDASSSQATAALQDYCTEFVHKMVRRNSSPPVDTLPELAQIRLLVQMTRHERALYHMAVHDHQSVSPHARMMRLLEHSSLHRAVAPSGQDQTTACDLCKEELEERRRPILQLEQEMRSQIALMGRQWNFVCMEAEQQCMLAEDLLSALIEHGGKDDDQTKLTLQHGSRQARETVFHRDAVGEVLATRMSNSFDPASDGQRAAHAFLTNERHLSDGLVCVAQTPTQASADHARWALHEFRDAVENERENVQRLADLYKPLLLFQSSLAKADDGFTCPICYEECHRDLLCIASCTHIACSSCWAHIFDQQEPGRATCPMCRGFLSRLDVLPLSGHVGNILATMASQELHSLQRTEVKRAQEAAGSEEWALKFARVKDLDDLADYGAYGTKARSVIETLMRIRTADRYVKVLIFVQWEVMKHTLNTAFDHFQISHVNLRGSTYERAALLRQFAKTDGPWVMLLSMEISPSGLNLVAANHVLLVQPTWHENSHEKSVDFEEQAIGRCWRQGQQRTVHVWRLYTENTVEEEFVNEHIRIWDSRVRARRGHAS